MDDEKRRLRDEVAELSRAVRGLREQLAKRDEHHGQCLHWHYHPVPVVAPYPWWQVTYPQYQTICASTTTAAPDVTYANTAASNAISYS